MNLELFKKLVEEIARHRDTVERVHLHNYGEPLLDRDLIRRIRFAKDCGIKHTYFVTNASLLTPEISLELIRSGIDEFKISFLGTDAQTYNNTMRGLDFSVTMKNITTFFKLRRQMGVKRPKVSIQHIAGPSDIVRPRDFKNLWEKVIDEGKGDACLVSNLHSYGGGRVQHASSAGNGKPCHFPWHVMVILWDGRVSLCCMDFNGEKILGNIRRSMIEDVWNNALYVKVREDFKGLRYQDYPMCQRCDWSLDSSLRSETRKIWIAEDMSLQRSSSDGRSGERSS